jgi:hypothetical protein
LGIADYEATQEELIVVCLIDRPKLEAPPAPNHISLCLRAYFRIVFGVWKIVEHPSISRECAEGDIVEAAVGATRYG